jgi:hypothetical protein
LGDATEEEEIAVGTRRSRNPSIEYLLVQTPVRVSRGSYPRVPSLSVPRGELAGQLRTRDVTARRLR